MFFCNNTPTAYIYTLSLHDALPICVDRGLHVARQRRHRHHRVRVELLRGGCTVDGRKEPDHRRIVDRKSTRLNSSHVEISYAVFCLKKKKDLRNDYS